MNPKNPLPSWLEPKTSGKNVAIFIGWYTEEQWRKIKETAIDADTLDATYAEWLHAAEKLLQDLRATGGVLVEKHYIDADDFLAVTVHSPYAAAEIAGSAGSGKPLRAAAMTVPR